MAGRLVGTGTRGARAAVTVLALVATALAIAAAPVAATVVGPVGPVAASMPGPVGAVQTEIIGIAQPREVTVAGDGSMWFNSGDSRYRVVAGDDRYQPMPGHGRITTGPDGEIWSVDFNGVDRITAAGTVTHLANTVNLGQPQAITTGPDGNLWVTSIGLSGNPDSIVRVTPTGVFTSFTDASLLGPGDIAAGPDGDLWFVDQGRIGRITTAGVISQVALPGGVVAVSIVGGGDGNVWFAGGPTIGRVTPGGTVTTFTAPGITEAGDIVLGADGNLWARTGSPSTLASVSAAGAITVVPASGLEASGSLAAVPGGGLWFGDVARDVVGQVTFAGAVTEMPSVDFGPLAEVITGPDGAVWVTAPGTDAVGRITEDFEVTTFTDPGIDDPNGITGGSDGNVWFTNTNSSSIGRITPAGIVTIFTGAGIDGPTATALGGDGNVWFVNDGDGSIGRITPAGVVTAFPASGIDVLTLIGGHPNDITAAPDGSLWFTSSGDDRIGRITTDGSIAWTTDSSTIFDPQLIVATPDGSIWWANRTINQVPPKASIARRSTDGGLSTVHVSNILRPVGFDLDLGPDGNVWTSVTRLAPDGALRPVVPGSESISTPPGVGPEGAMWSGGTRTMTRVKVVADGTVMFRSAVAGKERATVSWEPPRMPVGAPITGYSVVATPGGASCSTTGATSCVVSGLTAGTSYTFAIRAIGSGGPGAAAVTSSVVPWSGSGYHPLVPSRILDSRLPDVGFTGRVVAGTPRSLPVTGLGGASNVPGSASAVVLNVTVTDSTAESFLTVFPTGSSKPNASNLNFGAGQVIPNLVTVKLGAGGMVDLATAVGSTNVVADVVGYYDDGEVIGDRFTPTTPRRLLDTRTPSGGGPVVAGAPRDLVVEAPVQPTGAPSTASAVVVNVTVTGGTAQSFVSAWPSGTSQPGVSNLNLLPGQTIANLAVVKIGDDGAIRFANAVGSVDVIVDLVGWFDPTSGSRFHPVEPDRILDTRDGTGLSGKQGPGQTRALAVAGAAGTGVPAGATGMVANVTVADATAESFVSVFPGAGPRPDPFSNLNFATNQVIPNLTATGIAPDGTVGFYNHLGETHLIADLVGWYASY